MVLESMIVSGIAVWRYGEQLDRLILHLSRNKLGYRNVKPLDLLIWNLVEMTREAKVREKF
jgi:hypothetical protein